MNSRVIKVNRYCSHWIQLFQDEKIKIEQALNKQNICEIHHIGSTAVPGLCAKPIIDILLVIKSLDELENQVCALERLDYIAKGEAGIKGRRFYLKGEVDRTHHLHAFQVGCEHIQRHLAFRDYLIEFPKVKAEYAAIKQRAAQLCNHDIKKYMAYKHSFIQKYETAALCWKST